MERFLRCMAAGALVFLLSGCSAQTSDGKAAPAAAAAAVPIPPDSPLAKVQLGMSKKQVQDLLGSPSDQNAYMTGKAFIPFYFGNDARRASWFYKGVGNVVFADGNVFGGGSPEVVRVDYDPNESGVAR